MSPTTPIPSLDADALATATGGAARSKSSTSTSSDWQLQQQMQAITDSISDIKSQRQGSSLNKYLPMMLAVKVMRDNGY